MSFGLLAVASMAPSLFAGTYTVEDVEWYPSGSNVGIDGGTIGFSGKDVAYSLVANIGAPVGFLHQNASSNPSVVGQWRWKVRWVGAVGEPAPGSVSATVHSKGSGSTSTSAVTNTAGRPGYSSAQVLDPTFTGFGSSSYHNTPGTSNYPGFPPRPGDYDSDTPPYTELFDPHGVTFTHVSGTTYEGYVSYSVQSQAALSAHGEFSTTDGILYALHSSASASVNISVKVRLTHIAGVRVQSDLP